MKVKKIVDLSHPLTNQTQVYPGDPEVALSTATTIDNEGYNLFHITMGTQSGSHVDAPYHFRQDGNTIDNINLLRCMGAAVVVDMSHKKSKEAITMEEVKQYEEEIEKADVVLFRTDWYKKEGTDEFYEHPYLTEEAGKYLLNKDIKTVAIDAINIDNTGGTEFPIHDMYADADGLIAENLAFLDAINFENPFVIFLPLKLIGCDGSPVRAVAIEV